MHRRPQLEIVAPNASPEEAAAVVAALEQFMRNHALEPVADTGPRRSGWHAAALSEGIHRAPDHPPFWA
jgi:hypothetical protein